MCGICGFLDPSAASAAPELRAIAERMTETLRHRGPDFGDTWVDPKVGIALGHRRLSILELSPSGHQPMRSACGRYVLTFNGEIYNHHELREELEAAGAPPWRGGSDTEVLLEAVSRWGLLRAVERSNGMFAFALWDQQERRLHLVRDRLGEKPLYYGWVGRVFLFGSELKALRRHPSFPREIDRGALGLFLRYGYVPAPRSIYQGINKLPPGTMIAVSALDSEPSAPISYWSALKAAQEGLLNPFRGPDEEAVDQLNALLRDSIKLRMEADVPLGAFLSGGVDSSTVVALMQAQSHRPVRTFSIGFKEASYDEARHAAAVAEHLGTEHTQLQATPDDALEVIPKLSSLYDEPFSDSSQIPTYLVSRLTRPHVTVSLSGDGGDELFAGYNRHLWGKPIRTVTGWLPRSWRGLASTALTGLSPEAWDRLFQRAESFLPRKLRQRMPGEKLHKLASILDAPSPESIYRSLVSQWRDPSSIVREVSGPSESMHGEESRTASFDFTRRMMYLDLVSYLPDDILVKVDRATMALGLEARVPFLDHRVVEFAWRLPLSMKIREGRGKWILRQILARHVPRALTDRPKMGFGVPLDAWLRGSLRSWAQALLDEDRLRSEGFLDPEPIRRKWLEHLSGKRNWQHPLWAVLMFQAWLEKETS